MRKVKRRDQGENRIVAAKAGLMKGDQFVNFKEANSVL